MKKVALFVSIAIVGMATIMYALIARSPVEEAVSTVPSPTEVTEQQPETVPTEEQQPAERVTVVYDENGFTPAEVSVKAGTTVYFVNNSDIPLWVASNPHPQHTAYPQFDTVKVKGAMPKPGEEFKFTFDRLGNWGFHNHAASAHTGSINVTEE